MEALKRICHMHSKSADFRQMNHSNGLLLPLKSNALKRFESGKQDIAETENDGGRKAGLIHRDLNDVIGCIGGER